MKLNRAKTREARNKLIDDEQNRSLLNTGQIDQELLRMRNMTDDELQGEIISDIAFGGSLKKLIDSRIVPAQATPTGELPMVTRILDEPGFQSRLAANPQGRKFLTSIAPQLADARARRKEIRQPV